MQATKAWAGHPGPDEERAVAIIDITDELIEEVMTPAAARELAEQILAIADWADGGRSTVNTLRRAPDVDEHLRRLDD